MFEFLKRFGENKKSAVKAVKNMFEILPDDVFLVSYPKSGNTWVRHLIGNYIYDGKMDFVNGPEFMPDLHYNPEKINAIPFRPRFIKSHFPFRKEYPNVIYLVRDGRDVAVSLYYFLIKMKQLKPEVKFSDYLENYFFGGKSPFGHWNEHVFSWVKKNKGKNMLVIKYEDMLNEPKVMLEKMVRFSGLTIDQDKLGVAVERASFKSMQQDEKKNAEHLKTLGHDSSHTKYGIIREGKKGTWKEMFTEAEEKKFWDLYGDASLFLGYER